MLRNSLLVATALGAFVSCTVDPQRDSQRAAAQHGDAGDAALALTAPTKATTGAARLAVDGDDAQLTIDGPAAAALFVALKTVGTRIDASAQDARVERAGRELGCVGTHVGEGDAVFRCAVTFSAGGKAGPAPVDAVAGAEAGDAQVTPLAARAAGHRGAVYVTVTGRAAETMFERLSTISEVRDDENGLTLASKAGSSLICARSGGDGDDETTCSFDVSAEGALAPN
jgi:hypothetical protein